jgi:hypothetical protein
MPCQSSRKPLARFQRYFIGRIAFGHHRLHDAPFWKAGGNTSHIRFNNFDIPRETPQPGGTHGPGVSFAEFAENEIMVFSAGVAGSTGCFSLGR